MQTVTWPAGASIAPGHYYLIWNDSVAPPAGITPDATIALGISSSNGGVALFAPGNTTNPVDAVGTDSGYVEGAPLGATSDPANAYVRRTATGTTTTGMYVDTNDNLLDFVEQASQPHDSSDTTGTCGIPSETISGNAGVGGAVLSYIDIDGAPQTITADASGLYSLTVPSNWSGSLTPSKTGYSFTPANRTYSHVLSDQMGQDYVAAAATPIPNFGQVIINEVAWYGTINNRSADWIELYNPGSTDIDLTGWVLWAQDGVPTINLTGVIPAGGFYLLANYSVPLATSTPTAAASPTCLVFQLSDHVRIDQYFTGDLSQSGETLYLDDPNHVPIDYANRNGGSWPAGSTSNSRSMERAGLVPDSDTAWVTYANDTTPNFVHDCGGNRVYGSPGQANWAWSVTITPSPVPTKYKTPTPFPPTPFAHMVINEFLPRAGTDWNQDGAIDVYDEFIELKNLGPIAVNLQNWKIDDDANAGANPYSLPSKTLQPGQRAVYYGKATGILLKDSGGSVRLINARGVVIDQRTYGPVQYPDQSTCRLPDGYYWRFPCFPTPGNENAAKGILPAPPPSAAQPPPCLLSDVVPEPFRLAECFGFGTDIFNPKYWDDQSGFAEFIVKDLFNKGRQIVK